jgi:putative flippase GtrA
VVAPHICPVVRYVEYMSTTFQFARFLLVGLIGLGVLLAVTYILTTFFSLWYFWSYILGTLISWTSIFFMNSFFTFAGHNKERYATKYVSFLVMYLSAFAVNATIVYTLTSIAGLMYLASITIATAVTTLITFTLSKRHIFTYDSTSV